MENALVRKESFERAKDEIRIFSEKTPTDINISTFRTEGGLFNWFDHKVTGSEINYNLVEPLQKILIAQNENIRDIFTLAGKTYEALEAIDRDCMQGIMNASNQAVNTAKIAEQNIILLANKIKENNDQLNYQLNQRLSLIEKAPKIQKNVLITCVCCAIVSIVNIGIVIYGMI